MSNNINHTSSMSMPGAGFKDDGFEEKQNEKKNNSSRTPSAKNHNSNNQQKLERTSSSKKDISQKKSKTGNTSTPAANNNKNSSPRSSKKSSDVNKSKKDFKKSHQKNDAEDDDETQSSSSSSSSDDEEMKLFLKPVVDLKTQQLQEAEKQKRKEELNLNQKQRTVARGGGGRRQGDENDDSDEKDDNNKTRRPPSGGDVASPSSSVGRSRSPYHQVADSTNTNSKNNQNTPLHHHHHSIAKSDDHFTPTQPNRHMNPQAQTRMRVIADLLSDARYRSQATAERMLALEKEAETSTSFLNQQYHLNLQQNQQNSAHAMPTETNNAVTPPAASVGTFITSTPLSQTKNKNKVDALTPSSLLSPSPSIVQQQQQQLPGNVELKERESDPGDIEALLAKALLIKSSPTDVALATIKLHAALQRKKKRTSELHSQLDIIKGQLAHRAQMVENLRGTLWREILHLRMQLVHAKSSAAAFSQNSLMNGTNQTMLSENGNNNNTNSTFAMLSGQPTSEDLAIRNIKLRSQASIGISDETFHMLELALKKYDNPSDAMNALLDKAETLAGVVGKLLDEAALKTAEIAGMKRKNAEVQRELSQSNIKIRDLHRMIGQKQFLEKQMGEANDGNNNHHHSGVSSSTTSLIAKLLGMNSWTRNLGGFGGGDDGGAEESESGIMKRLLMDTLQQNEDLKREVESLQQKLGEMINNDQNNSSNNNNNCNNNLESSLNRNAEGELDSMLLKNAENKDNDKKDRDSLMGSQFSISTQEEESNENETGETSSSNEENDDSLRSSIAEKADKLGKKANNNKIKAKNAKSTSKNNKISSSNKNTKTASVTKNNNKNINIKTTTIKSKSDELAATKKQHSSQQPPSPVDVVDDVNKNQEQRAREPSPDAPSPLADSGVNNITNSAENPDCFLSQKTSPTADDPIKQKYLQVLKEKQALVVELDQAKQDLEKSRVNLESATSTWTSEKETLEKQIEESFAASKRSSSTKIAPNRQDETLVRQNADLKKKLDEISKRESDVAQRLFEYESSGGAAGAGGAGGGVKKGRFRGAALIAGKLGAGRGGSNSSPSASPGNETLEDLMGGGVGAQDFLDEDALIENLFEECVTVKRNWYMRELETLSLMHATVLFAVFGIAPKNSSLGNSPVRNTNAKKSAPQTHEQGTQCKLEKDVPVAAAVSTANNSNHNNTKKLSAPPIPKPGAKKVTPSSTKTGNNSNKGHSKDDTDETESSMKPTSGNRLPLTATDLMSSFNMDAWNTDNDDLTRVLYQQQLDRNEVHEQQVQTDQVQVLSLTDFMLLKSLAASKPQSEDKECFVTPHSIGLNLMKAACTQLGAIRTEERGISCKLLKDQKPDENDAATASSFFIVEAAASEMQQRLIQDSDIDEKTKEIIQKYLQTTVSSAAAVVMMQREQHQQKLEMEHQQELLEEKEAEEEAEEQRVASLIQMENVDGDENKNNSDKNADGEASSQTHHNSKRKPSNFFMTAPTISSQNKQNEDLVQNQDQRRNRSNSLQNNNSRVVLFGETFLGANNNNNNVFLSSFSNHPMSGLSAAELAKLGESAIFRQQQTMNQSQSNHFLQTNNSSHVPSGRSSAVGGISQTNTSVNNIDTATRRRRGEIIPLMTNEQLLADYVPKSYWNDEDKKNNNKYRNDADAVKFSLHQGTQTIPVDFADSEAVVKKIIDQHRSKLFEQHESSLEEFIRKEQERKMKKQSPQKQREEEEDDEKTRSKNNNNDNSDEESFTFDPVEERRTRRLANTANISLDGGVAIGASVQDNNKNNKAKINSASSSVNQENSSSMKLPSLVERIEHALKELAVAVVSKSNAYRAAVLDRYGLETHKPLEWMEQRLKSMSSKLLQLAEGSLDLADAIWVTSSSSLFPANMKSGSLHNNNNNQQNQSTASTTTSSSHLASLLVKAAADAQESDTTNENRRIVMEILSKKKLFGPAIFSQMSEMAMMMQNGKQDTFIVGDRNHDQGDFGISMISALPIIQASNIDALRDRERIERLKRLMNENNKNNNTQHKDENSSRNVNNNDRTTSNSVLFSGQQHHREELPVEDDQESKNEALGKVRKNPSSFSFLPAIFARNNNSNNNEATQHNPFATIITTPNTVDATASATFPLTPPPRVRRHQALMQYVIDQHQKDTLVKTNEKLEPNQQNRIPPEPEVIHHHQQQQLTQDGVSPNRLQQNQRHNFSTSPLPLPIQSPSSSSRQQGRSPPNIILDTNTFAENNQNYSKRAAAAAATTTVSMTAILDLEAMLSGEQAFFNNLPTSIQVMEKRKSDMLLREDEELKKYPNVMSVDDEEFFGNRQHNQQNIMANANNFTAASSHHLGLFSPVDASKQQQQQKMNSASPATAATANNNNPLAAAGRSVSNIATKRMKFLRQQQNEKR